MVVYSPTLFRIAGFNAEKSDLLTGFGNIVTMVCCVFAIFTIDRFGRRKVLMVGGIGQSLCFFLLGALSKVGADKHSASIGAAAGSFIFIYNFVFAATWLSVPWVCECIYHTSNPLSFKRRLSTNDSSSPSQTPPRSSP